MATNEASLIASDELLELLERRSFTLLPMIDTRDLDEIEEHPNRNPFKEEAEQLKKLARSFRAEVLALARLELGVRPVLIADDNS